MAAKTKSAKEKKVFNLFNKDIKDAFLATYPDDTRSTYIRILGKSYAAEEAMDKDLYDFTKLEIEDILYDLNPLTSAVSQSNGRIISAYINWAISKGYRSNQINPLKTVDASWFDKFVDKTKKIYFSLKEVRDIERFCENAQDAVIFSLLFDGINGKEVSEIRNIKKKDFNPETNIVKVTDNNGKTRKVKVSDNSIKLLQEASIEETYVKKNGYMVDGSNGEITKLNPSDFVLRSSKTVDETEINEDAIHLSVIYRRITNISKTLGIPYLSTKNVFRSGMIYYGMQLLKENNTLGKREFEMIAEKFMIKNPYSIKEYCNYDTIKELYNVEIQSIENIND